MAEKKNIKVVIFQIKCSLRELQERDRIRPGVKEGCRKRMGDEKIKDIYEHLEETVFPNAIILDTEHLSIKDCVDKIMQDLNK